MGVLTSIGLAGALERLLYGMRSLDFVVVVGVVVAMIVVSLAACYLPATRALRVDPRRALAGL